MTCVFAVVSVRVDPLKNKIQRGDKEVVALIASLGISVDYRVLSTGTAVCRLVKGSFAGQQFCRKATNELLLCEGSSTSHTFQHSHGDTQK